MWIFYYRERGDIDQNSLKRIGVIRFRLILKRAAWKISRITKKRLLLLSSGQTNYSRNSYHVMCMTIALWSLVFTKNSAIHTSYRIYKNFLLAWIAHGHIYLSLLSWVSIQKKSGGQGSDWFSYMKMT